MLVTDEVNSCGGAKLSGQIKNATIEFNLLRAGIN
jgi:hypothetical protein